jgi:ribokinase
LRVSVDCKTSANAGEKIIKQACAPVDNVVDTTGAGDCFTSAFAVARLRGKGMEDALRFATAAAAVCIQRSGAMPSMPSDAEVEAFLSNWK